MTMTRRRVLLSSFYLGGATALGILGCSDPSPAVDGAGPDGGVPGADTGVGSPWVVAGALFVAGSGGTFDLKPTLPPGTPTGGTFDVDPSGTALPAGMTLSADGVLAVGTAAAAVIDGVVFRYTTP